MPRKGQRTSLMPNATNETRALRFEFVRVKDVSTTDFSQIQLHNKDAWRNVERYIMKALAMLGDPTQIFTDDGDLFLYHTETANGYFNELVGRNRGVLSNVPCNTGMTQETAIETLNVLAAWGCELKITKATRITAKQFSVVTPPIMVQPRFLCPAPLYHKPQNWGRYEVTWYLTNTNRLQLHKVKLVPLTGDPDLIHPTCTHYQQRAILGYHPHLRGELPCLGDYNIPLMHAHNRVDLAAAMLLIRELLTMRSFKDQYTTQHLLGWMHPVTWCTSCGTAGRWHSDEAEQQRDRFRDQVCRSSWCGYLSPHCPDCSNIFREGPVSLGRCYRCTGGSYIEQFHIELLRRWYLSCDTCGKTECPKLVHHEVTSAIAPADMHSEPTWKNKVERAATTECHACWQKRLKITGAKQICLELVHSRETIFDNWRIYNVRDNAFFDQCPEISTGV